MPHDLTLWGAGTSRTLRAHWMLIELGLEYEFHPIGSRTGETLTPEFLRLNPKHKIPVLRHGSSVITESAAIIQYLSEMFPKPEQIFIPSTPESYRARKLAPGGLSSTSFSSGLTARRKFLPVRSCCPLSSRRKGG